MVVSDDLPPQLCAKVVKIRRRKRKVIKRKELEELIILATRAAHVARDKGFYKVSPEAIQCVQILRHMRTLPLTRLLITQTQAFRTLQFLATNGNPKIRSESNSLLDHWKSLLQNKA